MVVRAASEGPYISIVSLGGIACRRVDVLCSNVMEKY